MLGSVAEAEDVLQDAWLRWQAVDHSAIDDPTAFLSTVTTRLAINETQSARARREQYIGPWLPDPIDTSADPRLGAERAEALEFAVLLLLEKLPAPERAAYILRNAFDYEYVEIANILQTTDSNARQLVSRARKHVAGGRRAPADSAHQRQLLEAFVGAARDGNMAALESVLAEDVLSTTDSGGEVRAAMRTIFGRDRVARFLVGIAQRFWPGVQIAWTQANGQPAVLISRDSQPLVLAVVDASPDGIGQLLWVMHPGKLRRFLQ